MKKAVGWAVLTLTLAAPAAAGWTDPATITHLTARDQLHFTVSLALDKNSCKSRDTFYMDYNAPGAEIIYRTLLEALLAGKPVQLYGNGVCELNGFEGFSAVRLRP